MHGTSEWLPGQVRAASFEYCIANVVHYERTPLLKSLRH
jgi:hypothetical protein